MLNLIEELNKELKRLTDKYKAGFECTIDWRPTDLLSRPRLHRSNNKKLVVNGEWKGSTLIIYENESLEKIIHVLHHEFLERMLLTELVDPYVVLANSLQNVFKTMAYKRQEVQVEQLARLEDKEWSKRRKKRVKRKP